MSATIRQICIACAMMTTLVLGLSPAQAQQALPTVPPHASPPYVWHHDLIAEPPFFVAAPVAQPFTDTLAAPTEPWHIEAGIQAGPGGAPAGNLVISVPGGGWVIPYGPLAPGATFYVERLWMEAPEVGPWLAAWSPMPAAITGVNSSVCETPPTGHGTPTAFTFTGLPPPGYDIYLRICDDGSCIPTVSQWGLIIMTLLLLTAGTIVFARRRRVATA